MELDSWLLLMWNSKGSQNYGMTIKRSILKYYKSAWNILCVMHMSVKKIITENDRQFSSILLKYQKDYTDIEKKIEFRLKYAVCLLHQETKLVIWMIKGKKYLLT